MMRPVFYEVQSLARAEVSNKLHLCSNLLEWE
jgi:hypothetical protein